MSKLKTLLEILNERGKVDIRRRLLRLVLFGSILTFASLGLLTLIGMISTWSAINSRGAELSESAADYAEHFAEDQAHAHMLSTAEGKARLIRFELQSTVSDLSYLAEQARRILINPQDYPPRVLPEAHSSDIFTGEVYVFVNKDRLDNLTPEVEREIALLSNVATPMDFIANDFYSEYQATLSVGSKYNYVVCVDVDRGKREQTVYSEEIMNTYDITARPWYRDAIEADGLVFSDFYAAPNGYPVITCAMPYYDNDGIAGVVSIGCSLNSLYELVVENADGGSDIGFVLDEKGRVIISSQQEGLLKAGTDQILSEDEHFGDAAKRMLAGEKGVEIVELDGKEYFLAFAPIRVAGWSFATMLENDKVMMPALEARHNIERQMDDFKSSFRNVFLVLMLLAVPAVIRLLYSLIKSSAEVSRNFVKPIEELSNGVREIAAGDFDKQLNIKTGDEIEHLAVCFNAMTGELKKYMSNLTKVTADKERIATELDVATEIQASMLPRDFDFDQSEFELYATMHAAKEVGGDFYDFYLIDGDRLMITIADVSGKGVAAALFMVISKTIMKNFAMTMTSSNDLGALVTCTNNQLCQNNDAMMFVTMFAAVIDLKTGRMTYVNGGHNPPLIYRAATDRFEYLTSSARNYALGLMEDVDFEQETLELSAGDMIYLYTDGVTEALNTREELYGEERLEKCLNGLGAGNVSVEKILEAVRLSIEKYAEGAEQSDDITMIGLRYRGGDHD